MLYSSLIDTMTNRRDALRTLAGASVAVAGMAGLAGCAPGRPGITTRRAPVDFTDPVQNLKAFIRLTADLDSSKVSVSWFGGTIYGNRGTEPLKPLVGVSGVGVMRVETVGSDTYRVFNREFAAYSDPVGGRILEVWDNPYTGETVEVVPIRNMVVNAQIAPIIEQDFDGRKVSFPFTPPWIVQGEKAFSLFEIHAAFPNPMTPDKWPRESAGPVNRTGEMFQRMCALADLENPDVTAIDTVGTWTRVGPWLPWMLMGQAEGHCLYRCFMNRCRSINDLPANLLAYMEEKYPAFLQAPGPETWGQPNDSSWTVYMNEHEPKPARR